MQEENNEQFNNNNVNNDGFLKTSGLFIIEVVKITLIAAAVVLVIRYFLIQPFFVKGASMEPNFSDGQYLIIDELSYRLGPPHRGDVIVFRYPKDPKQFYIKRIIGLPDEQVEISDNRVIIYNGQHTGGEILEENYLPDNELTFPNKKWKLKEGEYFVMGDNRTASSDSRVWGTLNKKFVVGRVFLRAFPFDEFTIFRNAQVTEN